MSLMPLTVNELTEFAGGQLAVALNEKLRKIYLDLDNRPRLDKARKLTLEITFKPDEVENQLVGVEVDVQVKEAIPGLSVSTQYLVPNPETGCLMFNPISARADHPTLPFKDEE